jgi:cytochrome c biogenesis protein CcdA
LTERRGFAQSRHDNPGMAFHMLGLDSVDSVAHVIQVALTPVFLLSGIASLLRVLSTRLARVADRVDALAEQLESGGPVDGDRLRLRLAYLRRRSHVLDAAVMMGTLGAVATSCAGLLLFVGTLRDRPGIALFVAFGLALLFTMGALVAFLIEMLLASRGLRDQADRADAAGEATRTESAQLEDLDAASPAPRSVSGPHSG